MSWMKRISLGKSYTTMIDHKIGLYTLVMRLNETVSQTSYTDAVMKHDT